MDTAVMYEWKYHSATAKNVDLALKIQRPTANLTFSVCKHRNDDFTVLVEQS